MKKAQPSPQCVTGGGLSGSVLADLLGVHDEACDVFVLGFAPKTRRHAHTRGAKVTEQGGHLLLGEVERSTLRLRHLESNDLASLNNLNHHATV